MWLRGVIENDDDYKALSTQDEKDAAVLTFNEEFRAFIVLHSSHPKKYGQFKRDLRQFAVLKDDKYPKTMEGMCDALVKHPWDPDWHEYKKKERDQWNRRNRHDGDDELTNAQGHHQRGRSAQSETQGYLLLLWQNRPLSPRLF